MRMFIYFVELTTDNIRQDRMTMMLDRFPSFHFQFLGTCERSKDSWTDTDRCQIETAPILANPVSACRWQKFRREYAEIIDWRGFAPNRLLNNGAF